MPAAASRLRQSGRSFHVIQVASASWEDQGHTPVPGSSWARVSGRTLRVVAGASRPGPHTVHSLQRSPDTRKVQRSVACDAL
jgi:hypothetical protein